MPFEAKQTSRPLSRPAKKLGPLDVIVCGGIAMAFAAARGTSIDIARAVLAKHYARYDDELVKAYCEYNVRGIVDPAKTTVPGWAAELVQQLHLDVIGALVQRSAFAQLAQIGLQLSFGRAGRIAVPSFSPSVAGAFVREGEPIPVASGETTGQFLTPKKMAVIVTYTRELSEGSVPAMEGLLRARIQESTGVVLDSVLLDDQPATNYRPAGLLHQAEEVDTSGGMQGDLQSLAESVFESASNHVRSFVMIANPAQALAARLQSYRDVCPLIISSAVPPGTVIMLDATDFVCAGSDAPRFEISGQAAIHMESETPQHISNGGTASPVRSLWQTDTLGLRMILNVDWCLRRPHAVSFMEDVFWQSGGGGGMRAAKAILSGPFTSPAVGVTGIADVQGTRGVKIGDTVWVEPLGYFEVTDLDSGP